MYIPPLTMILLVFSYLLYLLSSDWVMDPAGAWYRPFVIALLVIAAAAWIYREHNADDF